MIERDEIAHELKLREYIRTAINIVQSKRSQRLEEESRLRKIVRRLLHEEIQVEINTSQTQNARLRSVIRNFLREELITEKRAIAQAGRSTGINELDRLLNRIIEQIQSEYESLGTSLEQRQDFVRFFLKAVIKTLATVPKQGIPKVDQEEEIDIDLNEQKFSVEIDEEDAEKFIPVRDVDFEAEEEEEAAAKEAEKAQSPTDKMTAAFREEFDIEDDIEDDTGLKVAARAWNQVKSDVVNSYSLLGNPSDQEEFFEYLITNLRLYFDLFESEIGGATDNEGLPTTPAYEREQADIDAAYADDEAAGEAPPLDI